MVGSWMSYNARLQIIVNCSFLNGIAIKLADSISNFPPIKKQILSLIILHADRLKEIYLPDKPAQLNQPDSSNFKILTRRLYFV